ncbi:MAG: hypothetical protein ABSE06_06745 [Anaerolineaceae bacterium]|jgi:hypothetical protein
MHSAIHTIRLPFAVPYYAQVTSLELARAIFDEGLDARLDPRWQETGAQTAEEYAYWSGRACGPACVKMCVESLGGERRSLLDNIYQNLIKFLDIKYHIRIK